MPLSVVEDRDGLYIPVVICDGCGQRVENAFDGNYLYLTEEDGEPCSPIYFAHKRCTDALASEKAGDLWCCCAELSTLPAWLGNNLGLDVPLPEEEESDGAYSDGGYVGGFYNLLEENLDKMEQFDEYLWYLPI